METSIFSHAGIEIRETEQSKKLVGYASVFNSEYRNEFWGIIEIVRPGAFKRTLAEGADVRALVDHNPSLILGRTKSGTLSLREDSTGLWSEVDPPSTSTGQDIIQSVKRGDVDGMSFGFIPKDEAYSMRDGMLVRELLDVELFDVSFVTYPAYKDTKASLRAIREFRADGSLATKEYMQRRFEEAVGAGEAKKALRIAQEKYLAQIE